jgi:stearoyl-CoA desaturase (delta-9 desaturase)
MKNFTRFRMWQIKLLQYSSLTAILFTPLVSFSWTSILIMVIAYYAYSGIGVSMMLHRYWTHRSFEFKWKWLEVLLTLFACFAGRGSPLAWTHIHRDHHSNSDTPLDPHAPGDSLKLFSFKTTEIKKVKLYMIRDMLSNYNVHLHDYYLLLLIGYAVALFMIGGFSALYFAWLVPMTMYQLSQDLWNHYAHTPTVGVQPFETGDNSRNVKWLWPLVLGEAWHNNHHASPKDARLGRGWELDPVMLLINALRK